VEIDRTELERLIADIVVDAYGDDEQQTAFLTAFEEETRLPARATVLDIEVQVTGFDYRDERQGVLARCRREKVRQELAVADLVFPPGTTAAWVQAAYRQWLGLVPHPADLPPGWTVSWM
jgi:hypothetical protein